MVTTAPALNSPTRPPPEVLASVTRSDMPAVLRRLGVPGSLAPDLLQEVVTTAYVALHRRGVELLPAERGPRWGLRLFLTGIVRRHARDARRRGYQRHEVPVGLVDDLRPTDDASSEASPEQRAVGAQRLAVLLRVLGEMAPEYAETLLLYAVQEMTTAEIGVKLGVNESTVKSRLARARAEARAAIQNLPEDERRLLRGAPLAALFFGWGEETAPPRSRWPAGLVVLIAGLCIVGSPLGRLPAAHELPRAAPGEVHALGLGLEVRPDAPSPAPTPGDALPEPPPPEVAPVERRRPPVASSRSLPVLPVRVDQGDTLPAERAMIASARSAMDTDALADVLVQLAEHEHRYPEGKLAGVREELKSEVRGRMRAKMAASR